MVGGRYGTMPQSSSDQLHSKGLQNSGIVPGISGLEEARDAAGINLEELPVGASVVVATGHHSYRMENLGDGNILISGHPKYCPQPVEAKLHGSIGADGYLKWRYIGTGLQMMFEPAGHEAVRTSPVTSIKRQTGGSPASN